MIYKDKEIRVAARKYGISERELRAELRKYSSGKRSAVDWDSARKQVEPIVMSIADDVSRRINLEARDLFIPGVPGVSYNRQWILELLIEELQRRV